MADEANAEVSVVIPCYRCADTIERAVASVAAQTWRPAEVILIDDQSEDDTLGALYELQRRHPEGWVRVIPQPFNGGPGEARNSGWDAACQRYVAFLDADDSWHPQKIEKQYGWMCKHPEATLTGHPYQRVTDSDGVPCGFSSEDFQVSADRVSVRTCVLKNRFPTSSVILKREVDFRFQGHRKYCEDYLLWCEIILNEGVCYKLNSAWAFWYKPAFGSDGLSGDLWEMEKGHLSAVWHLRKKRMISFYLFLFTITWSLTRYVRREIYSSIRSLLEKPHERDA